jgi:hypothetical protein
MYLSKRGLRLDHGRVCPTARLRPDVAPVTRLPALGGFWFKRALRRLQIVVDLENRAQPRDLQQVADYLGEVQQLHLTADLPRHALRYLTCFQPVFKVK